MEELIKDGPNTPHLGCNLGYFYGVSGSKTPARTAVIDLPSCPMQRSRTKARQRYTPTQNNQNNRRSSSLTLWKHPLHFPIRTRFRPDSAPVSAPWRVTGSDHARTCLPHACLVFELAGPHEQRRRQDVKIAIQLHNSEWKYQAPSVRGSGTEQRWRAKRSRVLWELGGLDIWSHHGTEWLAGSLFGPSSSGIGGPSIGMHRVAFRVSYVTKWGRTGERPVPVTQSKCCPRHIKRGFWIPIFSAIRSDDR